MTYICTKLLNISLLSLLLCSNSYSTEYLARVTYYWQGHITSTGIKPVSNKTIAVDPKKIPYRSKVFIPQMGKTFLAQDTGRHVCSREASRKLGKSNIVVDIYCRNQKEASTYIKRYPMFMKIIISK